MNNPRLSDGLIFRDAKQFKKAVSTGSLIHGYEMYIAQGTRDTRLMQNSMEIALGFAWLGRW